MDRARDGSLSVPTPARVPGKYGRRPPKNAPALKFSRYLTGVVPAHPNAVDYIAAMGGGWEMLGNDVAGDCVSVTWANVRRMVTKVLSSTEDYPSQAEVWALYQNPEPPVQPERRPQRRRSWLAR